MSVTDRKSDKKYDNKSEFGGSKSNVVVMLVLVFFVSLLSFSIGIFVGKKFSDNHYKQTKMEPSSHGNEKDEKLAADGSHGEGSAHGETAVSEGRQVASADEGKIGEHLSDDEIAKLAEEFVTDEEPKKGSDHTAKNAHGDVNAHGNANAHGNDHGSAVVAPAHEDAHAVAAPLPAAQKIANTRNPSNTNKNTAHTADTASKPAHSAETTAASNAAKIPSHLPAETAKSDSGKFTVQVASYQNEKEAQNMTTQLKSKGYNSFYVQAHVNNQTWYRVCVGPLFTTLKQADEFKKDILSKKVVASAIIQKIENH